MFRSITILVLTILSLFLVFEFSQMNVAANSTDDLSQVLENQKIILEKLNIIDQKLDVIKMRVRI